MSTPSEASASTLTRSPSTECAADDQPDRVTEVEILAPFKSFALWRSEHTHQHAHLYGPWPRAHFFSSNDEAADMSDIPMDAPSPGSVANAPTTAEQRREQKLREDPVCEIHSSYLVSCNICGNRIKLSLKSAYDPSHWIKHRERCLRKSGGGARVRKLRDRRRATVKAGDSATPPLTTDDDTSSTSVSIKAESPSPSLSSVVAPSHEFPPRSITTIRQASNLTFEDYLLESHRDLTAPSGVGDRHWQTWSWQCLKPPIFQQPEGCEDEETDDEDDLDLEPRHMFKLVAIPGY